MKSKLIRITTVPVSLEKPLDGQLSIYEGIFGCTKDIIQSRKYLILYYNHFKRCEINVAKKIYRVVWK